MAKKTDPTKVFRDKMAKIRKKLLRTKTLDDIGEKAVDMLVQRTRLGYGIKEPGSQKQKKLDKLSPKYKAYRKLHKPTGNSTPAKSNLTYTGQMLDDVQYKVQGEKRDGRSVEIGIYEDESAKKAGWVTDGGRAFMGLTKAQVKELKIWIGRNLRKLTK